MANDGFSSPNHLPARNLFSPLMTEKNVGAAEVARTTWQTLQVRVLLQGRLHTRTGFGNSLEYWNDEQCSLPTALIIDELAK